MVLWPVPLLLAALCATDSLLLTALCATLLAALCALADGPHALPLLPLGCRSISQIQRRGASCQVPALHPTAPIISGPILTSTHQNKPTHAAPTITCPPQTRTCCLFTLHLPAQALLRPAHAASLPRPFRLRPDTASRMSPPHSAPPAPPARARLELAHLAFHAAHATAGPPCTRTCTSTARTHRPRPVPDRHLSPPHAAPAGSGLPPTCTYRHFIMHSPHPPAPARLRPALQSCRLFTPHLPAPAHLRPAHVTISYCTARTHRLRPDSDRCCLLGPHLPALPTKHLSPYHPARPAPTGPGTTPTRACLHFISAAPPARARL